jgi:2-polyprenyl-3-methyl-5-hydroxy-6-metoxy-1,4-benzoquinol methylase
MKNPLHARIASLYGKRWDHHYTASKLRSDPLYQAVHEQLRDSRLPLLDLGCGLGLLALYLRETGVDVPIHGLDYDPRKITAARTALGRSRHAGLDFAAHDLREGLPNHSGNVTILDILQFFTPAGQAALLEAAAGRVAPGGRLIIRSGLRDRSWRFRITVAGDLLAKASAWMKAAPTHYPAAEDFHRLLARFGKVTIRPLWGRTPFNNHLIVMEKP